MQGAWVPSLVRELDSNATTKIWYSQINITKKKKNLTRHRQPLSPQPTKNFLVQVSVVPALRKPTRGAAVAAMWEGPVGLHGFKDQNEALVG